MPRIPFAAQTATESATSWSQQRVVNMMARPAPPNARVDLALMPVPGLTPWGFAAAGSGPMHVMVPRRDSFVVLSGDEFFEASPVLGTVTSLGSATGGNKALATGDASSVQVAVVYPPYLFVATDGGGTATVSSLPSGNGFGSVAVVDGFAVYTEAPTVGTSSKFWVSNLLAAQTVNALNFASAESATDGLLRAFNMRGDLWLFGARSIEIWANAGTVGVPFQRRPGGTIPIGLAAVASPAMVGDAVCWLGDDLSVYRSSGGEPQRISTFAIENEIRATIGVGSASLARGLSLTFAGHQMYVLTFPASGQLRTFVWDASTNLWHERTSSGTRWIGNAALYFNGRQYVGASNDGRIHLLDRAALTDAGSTMLRQATLPPLWGATRRAFMSRLELEVGRVNTAGTSLLVGMSYSDDGGTTFINSRGLIYDASTDPRLVWHRLGSFRQRTIRFDLPNDWPHALYAADAQIEGGAT